MSHPSNDLPDSTAPTLHAEPTAASLPPRPPPTAAPARGGALVSVRTRKEIQRALAEFPDLFPIGWDDEDVIGFMNQARGWGWVCVWVGFDHSSETP